MLLDLTIPGTKPRDLTYWTKRNRFRVGRAGFPRGSSSRLGPFALAGDRHASRIHNPGNQVAILGKGIELLPT